ncbi:MAG: hypothetical protein M3342_06655 [Bacteroidota bacterium]|nr:hypothetical protein [Bacteroidota bacterium]
MHELFQPLHEGMYYHLFNRGNNGNLIFFNERNYYYFLEKFGDYLLPYLDVYAYSLLPNHFHILVRVKEFVILPPEVRRLRSGTSWLELPEEIISEQFRRFFLSYAKSIKEQEQRTGSLFEKNFKRKQVSTNAYFTVTINYIHRNPETHGYCSDYKTYPYSSYQSLLSDKPTKLKREEVLDWFGGKEQFIQYHEANSVIKEAEFLVIE